MFGGHSGNKELYDILGVDPDCSKQDIKAAYKRLAIRYHPDKLKDGASDEDKERFVKISQAYEILSDDEKRANYDRFGAVDEAPSTPAYNEFMDILGFMFAKKTNSINPIVLEISLSLRDVILGAKKPVFYERQALLSIGTNQVIPQRDIPKIIFACEYCKGSGMERNVTRNMYMVTQTLIPCSKCKKLGYINMYPNKYRVGKKKCKFEYIFPKGVENGTTIKLDDIGDINMLNPAEVGPVIMQIKYDMSSSTGFTLDFRNNLVYKQKISVFESITGTEFEIEHPDGSRLRITIKTPIQHGFQKIIKQYGIPRATGMTDLMIIFEILYPTNLICEEINMIKTTFSEYYHTRTSKDCIEFS
jgi:molecular chaperone DnaJ